MLKAGLENEIARLLRQRAAHIDDQHDIRRRIHNARYDQQHAAARLVAIRQDIAKRTPTRGDAFTMEIAGRTTNERKVAGASLLSKIRMAILERDARDWVIGRIAGFDLTCSVSRNLAGGLFSGHLVLQRTGYEQVIDVQDDLTALGLISRLEYVLDRFEADIEEQTRRAADAAQRRAGYEPRLGEVFPLQAELDERLARMAELEAELAKTESIVGEGNTNEPRLRTHNQ
jgi:hypothetical protein